MAESRGNGGAGDFSLARPFEALLLALNSIGTIWIFVLMVVINIDVVGRTAFTRPLPGVAELVKLSIVAIVFLQIGYTLRTGRITQVDTLTGKLRRTHPRLTALLQGVYSLLGALLFVILFVACRPLFVRAWVNNDYAGVEGYVTYPYWPVYLILLIGCACSAVQFLIFAAAELAVTAGLRAPTATDRPAGPPDIGGLQ